MDNVFTAFFKKLVRNVLEKIQNSVKNTFLGKIKNPESLVYQGLPDVYLAGVERLELPARGFGDRCSTN